MKKYLNILEKIRQKIPSTIRNLVILLTSSYPIPRKTKISGHFRLNTVNFSKKTLKIFLLNYLIFREITNQ